jgi:glycosyltransferase involved in cell wall biosynthesis
MRVLLAGYFYEPTGYGELSRQVAAALTQAGHEVIAHPFYGMSSKSPTGLGWMADVAHGLPREGDANVVVVVSPPQSFRTCRVPGAVHLGYTMVEHDKCPDLDAAIIASMDGVLTPTDWNAQTFAECGVPVSVVHPAIDPQVLQTELRSEPRVLYSCFEWQHRHKDPVSLLEAYFRAFTPEDGTLLRIKASSPEAPIDRDIREAARRAGLGCKGQPPHRRALSDVSFDDAPAVEVIVGSMTRAKLLSLMAQASAYVAPHRAEGWGLPLAEAIAMGLPVAATRFGGSMQFTTDENAILVDPLRVEGGQAVLDVEGLARAMRRLVFNPPPALPKSMRRFSLADMAERIETAANAALATQNKGAAE